MSYETLSLEIDERGVARLQLARPDKRNAMSAVMISELADAASALGGDPSVRAVVLGGQGSVFCAGADLAWMLFLPQNSYPLNHYTASCDN